MCGALLALSKVEVLAKTGMVSLNGERKQEVKGEEGSASLPAQDSFVDANEDPRNWHEITDQLTGRP